MLGVSAPKARAGRTFHFHGNPQGMSRYHAIKIHARLKAQPPRIQEETNMMITKRISVERICVESSKSFEDVLAELGKGIGRPNMNELQPKLNAASSFAEFQQLINGVVGSADLMEFLRLDLGGAMKKDPDTKAYRIVRIITGNPLIMKQMVEHVPDAGSYAPVTILVYERLGKVHICYDTMESLLTSYGDAAALAVAKDLDKKVMTLIAQAAG